MFVYCWPFVFLRERKNKKKSRTCAYNLPYLFYLYERNENESKQNNENSKPFKDRNVQCIRNCLKTYRKNRITIKEWKKWSYYEEKRRNRIIELASEHLLYILSIFVINVRIQHETIITWFFPFRRSKKTTKNKNNNKWHEL